MTKPSIKFETARTRQFRATQLSRHEKGTLASIEKFGCSVLHVKDSDKDRPYFSYTVGAFDTTGQAEIITVGLPQETAHFLLNHAVDEMRSGVNLAQGRHADMIGNVDCEFRPVDPKWVKHLMNSANWYNGSSDYPVLQAIYPDLQNRFPEEEAFNEYFRQPMLQPDTNWKTMEDDFWASNDPESSLFDWKFPDPPHTGVYLSETVNSGIEAVTYVSHDTEDGAWQFLGDSMDAGGGPVLSCFHHPIDKDPTLKELADLPQGWYAVREKPGAPWTRHELEPDEEEVDATETE